jgi:hypothetical protein
MGAARAVRLCAVSPTRCAAEGGDCSCLRRKLGHLEIVGELTTGEYRMLYGVIILDTDPHPLGHGLLTSGLNKLSVSFGLTGARKFHVINAQSRIAS